MSKRHVYVVDDDEPIRRSVSLLLKVSGFAPEAFDSGRAFIDAQSALDPGCVLLDVRMPDLDGMAVQRQLSERRAAHATIMMTGHGDVASAVAALDAGAVTFIEKPFSKTQLLPALEIAFSSIDQPETYQALLVSARDRIRALSSREQSVLALLAQDQSSAQIGMALELSAAEMDVSRARILQELGVESIPAALTIVFAAARAGG
jgi:two-component system, LuxR family, response regulator FixJ